MNIKAVSEETGFTSYTLRYYEKEGILQNISRNDSGHRVFHKDDIYVLKFIKCMRLTDMSINDLRKITDLLYKGEDTIPKRIEILREHKNYMMEKILHLQEAVNHIDHKLDFYEKHMSEISPKN